MKNSDYYWTTVRQLKVGTNFKTHPDNVTTYKRGCCLRPIRKYACAYVNSIFRDSPVYFDGSDIVCVIKGV